MPLVCGCRLDLEGCVQGEYNNSPPTSQATALTTPLVAQAISAAKHQVFIAGWWVSPELHLLRPWREHPESRLSTLLKRKAEEGVRVYVLVYDEMPVLPLDSEHTEDVLARLHRRVYVIRHRSRFGVNLSWSHHEKIVCCDQKVAFVGGLDMCFGRYDTHEHRLADEQSETWLGKDYCNPRYAARWVCTSVWHAPHTTLDCMWKQRQGLCGGCRCRERLGGPQAVPSHAMA